MLNFAAVKQIVIPEGNVIAIDDENNVRIWQAAFDAIVNGVSPLTLPSAVRAAVVYLKQQGVCEQNGTPTPTTPVDIKCNNGVIRIKDRELPYGYRRLIGIGFDGNVFYDAGMKLYGSDTLKFKFKASIACNVLGCYTSSSAQTNYSLYVGTSTATYLRYNGGSYNSRIDANDWYDVTITPTGSQGMRTDSTWTAKSFTTDSDLLIGTTSYGATSAKLTGALEGNIVVLGRETIIPCERVSDGKLGYYMKLANRFIENQGTGTPTSLGYNNTYYDELFVDGTSEVITLNSQTANAENLFAVGDYKDEQEIIGGVLIHKVGIKVFNGTESYSSMNYGYATEELNDFANESFAPLCTHFMGKTTASASTDTIRLYFTSGDVPRTYFFVDKTVDDFSTVDKFKAWLANQYAAGTPVIVIYPLADETTEQVTAQPLDTEEGNNVVTVTAEVSNIPLEVKYKRT